MVIIMLMCVQCVIIVLIFVERGHYCADVCVTPGTQSIIKEQLIDALEEYSMCE